MNGAHRTSTNFKLFSINFSFCIRPWQRNPTGGDTIRYDTIRYDATRHDTTRRDTTRRDTIQSHQHKLFVTPSYLSSYYREIFLFNLTMRLYFMTLPIFIFRVLYYSLLNDTKVVLLL